MIFPISLRIQKNKLLLGHQNLQSNAVYYRHKHIDYALITNFVLIILLYM